MSLTTDGKPLLRNPRLTAPLAGDHSAVIQLAIDTCDSNARYLLTQTDLANIRRDCNRILKELSEGGWRND